APFIKGGAIIAIDPNTAEILAMASYPRFDPNHYISSDDKRSHNLDIISYLEDEKTVKAIWDGLIPLKKERYNAKSDEVFEDNVLLTWNLFLELILKPSGEVKALMNEILTLEQAQKALNKPQLNPYVYDLIRLNISLDRFTPELKKKLAKLNLNDYRSHEQAFNLIEEGVREKSKALFRDIDFKKWREQHEKKFIAEKRTYEKEHKIFPKPYLDYIDEEEKRQFELFWHDKKEALILAFLKAPNFYDEYSETLQVLAGEFKKGAHPEHYLAKPFAQLEPFLQKLSLDDAKAYLKTFRNLDERKEPLKAPWRLKGKKEKTLSDLALSFYPHYGYGFLRSYAYRQAATQGSIFKLITAYTALKKGNKALPEMKDQLFKIGSQVFVGYDKNGKPIPQLYKGGRIPRSSHNQMGDMDLLTAIEKSSNPYFALLAMDYIDQPSDLLEAAKAFSFGEKTGIALPGEIAGNLPKDLDTNPTGLFATSIGQHTLVVTPLQTSVMLSALANKGLVMKPQIIKCKAGKEKAEWDEIPNLSNYPLEAPLNLLGVDFTLFKPLLDPELKEPIIVTRPEVKRDLHLPEGIRKMLLEGMRRVVTKTLSDNLFLLSKAYNHHPEIMSSFIEMKPYLVGKTSTAESIERLDLDEPNERPLYTHVWFGGIGFEDEGHKKPELVVVVYLRYGGYGKEAAPMAAHIMKKWREIKEKNREP
ncbi:MAG: penicillin-binding transpeptidase domain-containing protein, partial [Parachlamydiaceae bacterium]